MPGQSPISVKILLRWYFPVLIAFTIFAGFNKHRNPEEIFSSDPEGYYMYLAAPFFSGGFDHYESKIYLPYPGTDKVFTKYTYGTALLEAPFVFVAQLIYRLKEGDQDTNGRSPIHGKGLMFAYFFYSLASLWLLRRFLEKRFDPVWVMVALCGLYLGTNWFFYTYKEPGTSHIPSLFVLSCWLIFVPKLYREPSARNFVLAGLIFGLTCLIRPTNSMAIFYLLFAEFKAPNGGTLRERALFFVKNVQFLPHFSIVLLLVWIPQFWYWHYATGHWFLWSYGEEGFVNWRSPKILNVLFDVQNGLFVYAPILFFPLIGLMRGIWQKQREDIGIFGLLSIMTYLFASWWIWSFGGAYGHRCYVDWMCFLSLPFCWFLQDMVAPAPRLMRAMVLAGILFLMYLSVGMSYLYQWPWEGPEWTWQKLFGILQQLLPF